MLPDAHDDDRADENDQDDCPHGPPCSAATHGDEEPTALRREEQHSLNAVDQSATTPMKSRGSPGEIVMTPSGRACLFGGSR